MISFKDLAGKLFVLSAIHGMATTPFGRIAGYLTRHGRETLETGGTVTAPFTSGTWQHEVISVAVLQLLEAWRPNAEPEHLQAVRRAVNLLGDPPPALHASPSIEEVACHVVEQCKLHAMEETTTMRLMCYIAIFGASDLHYGGYGVETLAHPTAAQELISEAATELWGAVRPNAEDRHGRIMTAKAALLQIQLVA